METDGEEQLIRVGDLAHASGLTVRALHHYEQIGLLAAPARSAAGHRLYGRDAIERVYRVNRLRRLGLSLDQIARVLDDPGWTLPNALRSHSAAVDDQIARLTALRAAMTAALGHLDDDDDPTTDLLEVLNMMEALETPLRRRISILVYRDLPAAHAYLVDVFGLTPGEVMRDPGGVPVHAELFAGDGMIWLHPESDTYQLASPQSLSASTATVAVMVDDVDEHHRLVTAKGGHIVYEPLDQPYGYREYSARDCEGGLWSFMKEIV